MWSPSRSSVDFTIPLWNVVFFDEVIALKRFPIYWSFVMAFHRHPANFPQTGSVLRIIKACFYNSLSKKQSYCWCFEITWCLYTDIVNDRRKCVCRLRDSVDCSVYPGKCTTNVLLQLVTERYVIECQLHKEDDVSIRSWLIQNSRVNPYRFVVHCAYGNNWTY